MYCSFKNKMHFFPTTLINTKTTIPLLGLVNILYLNACLSVYIHHYSPPLWELVVKYYTNTNIQEQNSNHSQQKRTNSNYIIGLPHSFFLKNFCHRLLPSPHLTTLLYLCISKKILEGFCCAGLTVDHFKFPAFLFFIIVIPTNHSQEPKTHFLAEKTTLNNF